MYRPGVLIYHNILPQLKMLTAAEAGELFRAVLHYSLEGSYDALPRTAEVIMTGLIPLIDRDNEKYERLCQQRRAAAISRWRKDHPGEEPDLTLLGSDPSRADLEAFANEC